MCIKYEDMPDMLDGKYFKKHLPFPEYMLREDRNHILSQRAKSKWMMGDLINVDTPKGFSVSPDEGF